MTFGLTGRIGRRHTRCMDREGNENRGTGMNGLKAALVVVVGTALAACQQTPETKAADASARTLEERVAALEQQAPPSAAAPADPAGLTISPEPGASSYVEGSAPPYVEQDAPAAPA